MPTPLVVPIELDALVVNEAYQGGQPVRRWTYNYTALEQFNSPEPEAGQGQSTTQPLAIGVHLRWTIPAALRRGVQTPAPTGGSQAGVGEVAYPAVPNRWLIVRLSTASDGTGRTPTAWVVESDCPNPDSPTQFLVDDDILQAWTNSGDPIRSAGAQSVIVSAQGGPPVALLGKAFDATTWTERAPTATFLTALAPGNATFAAYQPHHENVFAFTDPLDGVAADSLSYLVTGWYSNPAEDPLGPGPSAADAMTALGWTLVGAGPATEIAGSLYEGLALSVPWDPAASAAEPPTPLTDLAGKVTAAIAMTDVDALTSLVAAQPGQNLADAEVLQAFQYGLLPVFEQVNGPELLADGVHRAAFGSTVGGNRWTIAPASGDAGGDDTPMELTPGEAAWLVELNIAQERLQSAVQALSGGQWALYATWWKWQKGLAESVIVPPDGFDADAYAEAVQTVLPAAVASGVAAVTAALAAVPQPAPQPGDTREKAYARGVAAFADDKGLGEDKVLKSVPGPRFYRSGDPIVLLSGLAPATALDPSAPLDCRLASAVVDALTVDGTTLTVTGLGSAVPTPPVGGTPAPAPALLAETFLVDPASAAAIGAATSKVVADVAAAITTRAAPAYRVGTLPALGLEPWTSQPWSPLFMEWQVAYLDIPYETNGTANWSFDGHDYVFTGPFGPFPTDQQAPTRTIGGISLLTPQTQFTFRSQVDQFLDTYVRHAADPPASLSDLAAIEAGIEAINGWQVMSQDLTGFGDLVTMRDTRAQTAPDATVVTDVAGQTHAVPYIPNGTDDAFSAVRQGQFFFTMLMVYDAFGQVLQVVGGSGMTDPQHFAPVRDPALTPSTPAITKNPQRLIEVPPRVMQGARLDFLLVDATDAGRVVGTSPGANPVAGWILPNHLDRSLLLYAPDGTSVGSFGVLATDAGASSARWQPPAHSRMTFTQVQTLAPRLAAILSEAALADPGTFLAFLGAIDTTLWTTDPLGNRADVNLSVLIGRPLALVRAQLELTLDGPAVADQSGWATSWPPPVPDFLGYDYAIRLGDQPTRADGLIGYFEGDSTATFNTVPPPEGALGQTYLEQIGPVGATSDTNYLSLAFGATAATTVTMLVDPRAEVHAVTGILPVKSLTIPPSFVDEPLAALEVAFTAQTMPTTIVPTPGSTPPPVNPFAVSVPLPIEQGGTWAWWERSPTGPTGWASYDLARATSAAVLADQPTTVRDGVLQLIVDLAPSPPITPD